MYNVRKIEENINVYGQFHGRILYNEPLADRTTFKVGGRAAVLFEPEDVVSLQTVVSAAAKAEVPVAVLGGGSNVVVPDAGISYAVISTLAIDSVILKNNGRCVCCGSGCSMEALTAFCVGHNLGGLENFAGLPGSIGGAVYMNARCYEKSISDVLLSVMYITESGEGPFRYEFMAKDWDYKKSPFQSFLAGSTIVSAELSTIPLGQDEAVESAHKVVSYMDDRRGKGHFLYPSAGSVFKNNRDFGKPSGLIIDEAGLRGMRVGGAQVTPWHGNFIINTGGATACDIHQLTKEVVACVKERSGLVLEPEIIFLPPTK